MRAIGKRAASRANQRRRRGGREGIAEAHDIDRKAPTNRTDNRKRDMLNDQTGNSRHENRPLTHRDCFAAGRQAPAGGANAGRPWVQVRRYHPEGAFVLCGQVIELSEDGAEWFKVATIAGQVWARGQSLRMCSGDGRCTCEAEPPRARGATAQFTRAPMEKPGSTALCSIGINQPKTSATGRYTEGAAC